MLFAGFTAAKTTIIQNWFAPHMCGKIYWIHSLLQIVTYECTTAQINGAKPSTIDACQCFLFDIRDCIKEWLLCFSCPSLSSSLLTGLWDIECVSVVLFCYFLDVMLCIKNKKMLITKWDLHKEETMVFEVHCVISMYRTLIIQLCQGKDSFPFYGTFN